MEKTILTTLTHQFTQAIRKGFPELPLYQTEAEVTQSTSNEFGHYQCNSAMKLAKLVKRNPREIAKTIIDHFEGRDEKGRITLATLEIAGAGFINGVVDPEFLTSAVNAQLQDERLGVPPLEKRHRVVVEFSSPNTAKEMHVGHLRSTIIGECLARLLEFLGHDVLRLNHIGDRGTQFGMLIAYLKEEAPHTMGAEAKTSLTDLMNWYKAAKERFDVDPAFKKRSQLEVVALQEGNAQSVATWKSICEISRQAYQEIYDLLEVTLIERGESYYHPVLEKIVAQLEERGMVTLSEGAKCLFLEGFTNREGDPLPMIIQKADGGFNYDTTDMAAIHQRIFEEEADWLIYVTDAGQSLHFEMVFVAAEKAGWLDRSRIRVDHVPFGLVLGADGKKFRTRSGETEKLVDLLETAIDHARKILKERHLDLTSQEMEETALALGLGAVKYADLSCHRINNYHFSYEKMLRFEGNTAAFLLYSYVRILSIKRKVGVDMAALLNQEKIKLHHPCEVALALHLVRFGETIEALTRDLAPNRLTDYLYGLAEKFNLFFRDCRVEGSLEQSSRLLLCEAVERVMKKGLHILGLKTVQRM